MFEKTLSLIALPSPPLQPPDLAQLTQRERQVLQLIASGANNREIAQALFLSENTVKNYVTNILSRLNLRDRTQAALLAHSLFNVSSTEVIDYGCKSGKPPKSPKIGGL